LLRHYFVQIGGLEDYRTVRSFFIELYRLFNREPYDGRRVQPFSVGLP
jgi:hypothetical protein